MRVRRFLVGLVLTGLFGSGLAMQASADPIVPGGPDVPGAPTVPVPAVGIPPVDPNHPQIPSLPYVAIPEQLNGATGLLSPVVPIFCTASYLGPLAGIVALTAVFGQLPVAPPVSPSFISPLFSPFFTVCVLAEFPTISSCGPDAQITDALGTVGSNVPDPGSLGLGLGAVDPFDTVPAPFASVVVELYAIQRAMHDYALNGDDSPVDVAGTAATQLGCF